MIPVPPWIDISPYKMVNMNDIDLSKTSGVYVQGIFQELANDITDNLIVVFYNWNIAGIKIPPAYCELTRQGDKILLNGKIGVSVTDIVALEGEAAVLVSLYANNNGTFFPPEGADGFSHAMVEVTPVLKQELITQNGLYYPPENYDGFSMVEVDVQQGQPVLVPLSVTENGTYVPQISEDGFSSVNVNVPPPAAPRNISPDFFGLAYTYIAVNGWFYTSEGRIYSMSFFHVERGRYVIVLGTTLSNRFRVHFYAGKTYSDFEYYALNPITNAQIYQCSTNISGNVEGALDIRYWVDITEPGEIVIQSSNQSILSPAYIILLETL